MDTLRYTIKNTLKRISPITLEFVQDLQELRRRIKKRFPVLLEYYSAVVFQKPYWGSIYGGGGYGKESPKGILLRNAVKSISETNLQCLEVGSWTGNSAMIIGSILKEAGKGKLLCVDTWKGAPNYKKSTSGEIYALNKDWVWKTFCRNIKLAKLNDYIVPKRDTSDNISRTLSPESLDLVFIDGDHSYTQCKRDLLNYMPLIKVGGILCGDDLEIFFPDTNKELTIEKAEEDWVLENDGYHPGVTLAIHEVFKDGVNVKNSFWSVRKTETGWEK